MTELRKSSRANVHWRAAIRIADGCLLFVKIVNISADGLLMESAENLRVGGEYQMRVEIPPIERMQDHYKVNCRATVKHSILSEGLYRIGVQLADMTPLHQELVDAWISKILQIA